MSASRTGDPKIEFDLQHNTLCEVQRALLDNTAKVAGFLLLAIGWIATSETARKFLAADPPSRRATVAAVIAVFLLAALASVKAFKVSNVTYRRLVELNYVPVHCYAGRRVDTAVLVVYVIGNAALAALLVVVLLRLG